MNITILFLVAATTLRPGGDLRQTSMGDPVGGAGGAVTPAPTIAIGAQPYTRTTTCTGSYTLTGTATDVTSVAWAASPSGESGACTGTTSWSCAVAVSPDASGEGVETITVTATGDGGTGDDIETIGFYVAGAHSCFLAQSVDGSYNSTLVDSDPVDEWVNLGSSGLDVTQGTGTAQPTYRTEIVDVQPSVRCDGSDMVAASTAADWEFLHDGSDWTVDITAQWTAATTTGSFWATRSTTTAGSKGSALEIIVSTETGRVTVNNGTTSFPLNYTTPASSFADSLFHNVFVSLDDDGSSGADSQAVIDDGAPTTGTRAHAYGTGAPSFPFSMCASASLTRPITGDFFRLLIYQTQLSDVQRGINVSVDEWAFGGALPIPATASADSLWLFLGDSITAGAFGITSWPTKLYPSRPESTAFLVRAKSGAPSSAILDQWTNARGLGPDVVFVLGGINDIANGGAGAGAAAYSAFAQIYSEASFDGAQVVALLTPPFGTSSKWTTDRQAELDGLAGDIVADVNIDTLVDFYALLGDPLDPLDFDPARRVDSVHPNELGTTDMAAAVATSLGL